MTRPYPRFIRCTPSEIEVLTELMRDGAENNIIAKRTFRAEDTVKSHFRAVTRRAGTKNRTHLALALARREIVVITRAGLVHQF